MTDAPERIAGKTIAEWIEFSRRDDCLERMVPSDLRQLIGRIAAEREACAKVAEASIVPNKGFKELASNVRAERIAAAIRARKDSE